MTVPGFSMSFNKYGYVRGNPIMGTDPTGESYLIFNGQAETLTLYSKEGVRLGTWKASNNVRKKNDKGKWEDGRVKYAYHNPNSADGKDGSIGSHGSINFGDYKSSNPEEKGFPAFTETNGTERTTMAVHSGQEDLKGWETETNGCIRTTDEAMKSIVATHKGGDSLEYIEVHENKAQTNTSQAGRISRNNIFEPKEPNPHESPTAQFVNDYLDNPSKYNFLF